MKTVDSVFRALDLIGYSASGQFSLFHGNAFTLSLNSTPLIRTHSNKINGHWFLAQSTNSHRKAILLTRALHCQLRAVIDLSFFENKTLQLTACRCSQRYSTPDRMLYR